MSYTKGVIKIFNCSVVPVGTSLKELANIANTAGYKSFCFNGDVYVYDDKATPIKTVFKTSDFEV